MVIEPQAATTTNTRKDNKDTQQPFITEHPYAILKSGKIQNLPWITSVVESEGLYPAAGNVIV